MQRICVYTKDVQLITGKSDRLSREIINHIKKAKNKEKHQPVNIFELSEYLNIPPEEIARLIK